jgi:hypothetical protein
VNCSAISLGCKIRYSLPGSATTELVEADETPAVVIIRWPVKASVVHPHRFPDTFRQSLSQIPSIYAIYAGSLLASPRPVNASVTA